MMKIASTIHGISVMNGTSDAASVSRLSMSR